MGTRYFYLNLFHAVARNQTRSACESALSTVLFFMQEIRKREIWLPRSLCILLVPVGEGVVMMAMEDSDPPRTSSWVGSLGLEHLVHVSAQKSQ